MFGYCYRPQRSWAKVIFLHLSVILLTGGIPGLVPGGIPGLVWGKGCTWSGPWGVYLIWSWGVYLVWSQGGVPGRQPPWTRYPPRPGTPPRTRYTPWDQVHPPGLGTPPLPRTRYTPPRNMDNERPVRILLECILVNRS